MVNDDMINEWLNDGEWKAARNKVIQIICVNKNGTKTKNKLIILSTAKNYQLHRSPKQNLSIVIDTHCPTSLQAFVNTLWTAFSTHPFPN